MSTCRTLRLAGLASPLFALTIASASPADPGYFRHPAIHGDTVVFTAEGDLWTTTISGGKARRLTTHAGEESQAAISPDGFWVAFAGNYDSALEAYVMPLAGGPPRRLSFDGGRVWVQGWTPQGEVVYASENQSGPSGRRVLRAVDPRTLALRTLPLDDATEMSIDPRSGVVYFTRLGLLMTNDNARLYRGGALARIWRYDPQTAAEATRVTPAGSPSLVDSAQARPMWWNGRLYFVSDADGTHNLWSMGPDGADPRQLTHHRGWDVRGARLDGGRIAYQLGADLRWFEIASGTDRPIAVELVSDFEQRRERHRKQPLDYLTSVTFGGAGDHLLLTTRGQMAKVQPGPERRVEIAAARTSRSRAGVLSVDGKWVYAIHDAGGEQEIWRFAADGRNDAEALTRDGAIHRWRLVPSPDGRWLAHDDKRGRLWLLDLETRENREIDRGPQVGDDVYAGIVWSPDSKTLALVRADSPRLLNQVLLYSLAERRVHRLTSDRYESFAPAFSRDGRWLYFLSNRNFEANPSAPWGDRNMGPAFDRRSRIYAYALQSGQRFPFQAPDELASGTPAAEQKPEGDPKSAASDSDDKEKKDAKKLPAIQWAGLEDRLYEVPAQAGNYAALAADADRLYVLDENSGADATPDLKTLAVKSDSPDFEIFAKSVREFALSADGKKLYYRTFAEEGSGDLYVVAAGAKAPEGAALKKGLVRVGDWTLTIDPVQEWRQMFVDAWRMHRDFAFDAHLRGVDWKAVRTKYEPFVERLTDRGELDDLLGQMTGEIGILHSQVRGAELRKDGEAATFAGLGARLSRQAGGARIERIYRTEVELPGERGPLARPGVDVREGDVISAVNGRTLDGVTDISELLHNQAGQQVLLTLRRGTRDLQAVVVPVNGAREVALRYSDWVPRHASPRRGGGRGSHRLPPSAGHGRRRRDDLRA